VRTQWARQLGQPAVVAENDEVGRHAVAGQPGRYFRSTGGAVWFGGRVRFADNVAA
jgi:hypothetical protein